MNLNKSLIIVYPELAKQFHPTKNGNLKPRDVYAHCHKKIWWLCEYGHEWYTRIYLRTIRKYNCPYCCGVKIDKANNLAVIFPDIAKDWHPSRNSNLKPEMVAKCSYKKVWWLGTCGHEWEASVASRTHMKSNCPYCCGNAINIEKSIVTTNPELLKEWHPTKNSHKPEEISFGSNKNIWWICNKGHEYDMTAKQKTKSKGCPYCTRKRLCEDNCLSTTHIELSKEWHPIKNKINPQNVTFGSHKKVWWLGKCGHEWEAVIKDRAGKNAGCPTCSRLNKDREKTQKLLYRFIKKYIKITEYNYQHNELLFSKSNKRMELDIFLPNLNMAIEYQGEGHYFPIFGKEILKEQIRRDKEKRIACKAKGIHLIEITYKWDKKEKSLLEMLKEQGLKL